MTLTPLPHGNTARRLEWPFLPPHVRALVEQQCGAPVVDAVSQTAGFTPGFASVLTCADGGRHFVKAASVRAQRPFAEAYLTEARKLAALPDGVPAPRLRWEHRDEDWVVLGIEYVDARPPHRPWTAGDLDATLDALEAVADRTTPAPAAMGLGSFADEFGEFVDVWEQVAQLDPGRPHLAEAAALADGFAAVSGGETLVHTDIRDDNVLIDVAGRALLCDWNWPVAGADWLDTVFTLVGPRGDGVDVDAVLAQRRLTRDVPPEHVDAVLALLAGFFLRQRDLPVPSTSPWLRAHQSWMGEVTWRWLAERRGW